MVGVAGGVLTLMEVEPVEVGVVAGADSWEMTEGELGGEGKAVAIEVTRKLTLGPNTRQRRWMHFCFLLAR